MKKLSLLFIVLLFASCDNKVIEVQQEAGFDYGRDAKCILGTDEDAQLAVDLVLAFAKKDTEFMQKSMGDTVRYAPPQGGKMVTSLSSEIPDVVKMLHEP